MNGLGHLLGTRFSSGMGLHMSLIDPDKSHLDLVKLAERAVLAGTDVIAVGGSLGTTPQPTTELVRQIRIVTDTPIVLMPSPTCPIAQGVDGVFFWWLPQARDPRLFSLVAAQAASALRRSRAVIIPTAYLIFEPGMTAGRVLQADPLPRGRPDKRAVELATASELYGHQALWLEAGSGSPTSIAPCVVEAMRVAVRLPIVVGGGVRSPRIAADLIAAGADVVVTGNLLEDRDPRAVIDAIHATPRCHEFECEETM